MTQNDGFYVISKFTENQKDVKEIEKYTFKNVGRSIIGAVYKNTF